MKNLSRNALAMIVAVIVHIVVLIGLAQVRLSPPRAAPEYPTTWITVGSDKPKSDKQKVERARNTLQ